MLELVDDELSVLLFLDQAFGNVALLGGDRSIVLDAPYRHAARHQIDDKKHQPCNKIRRSGAEIDGHAEYASGQRRRYPDPVAAERGGEKYGWKIRCKENVRADQGQSPPHRGRQGEAGT